MNNKAIYLFVLAIICDITSMNIYRYFSQETGDMLYFSGQSLSVLFYIWTIVVLSKEHLFLNTLSTAYLPFAFNDLFETLTNQNTDVNWTEIVCGLISLFVIIYKYRNKILHLLKLKNSKL